MNVKIIAVGKLQRIYADIQQEFEKRLSRYCRFSITEVADEQAPEKLSEAQRTGIKLLEWEKIEKKLNDGDFLIILDGTGKKLSSVGLAEKIDSWQGKSLVFALGGSLGFHENALKRADFVLSLSDMTFTHSMARVILAEQIYRSFKIISGEPYHK